MLQWVQIGKKVNTLGERIVVYDATGTDLQIMSIRERIPHANRGGYWEKTFFDVYRDGEKLKRFYSLKEAKEYAEEAVRTTLIL